MTKKPRGPLRYSISLFLIVRGVRGTMAGAGPCPDVRCGAARRMRSARSCAGSSSSSSARSASAAASRTALSPHALCCVALRCALAVRPCADASRRRRQHVRGFAGQGPPARGGGRPLLQANLLQVRRKAQDASGLQVCTPHPNPPPKSQPPHGPDDLATPTPSIAASLPPVLANIAAAACSSTSSVGGPCSGSAQAWTAADAQGAWAAGESQRRAREGC